MHLAKIILGQPIGQVFLSLVEHCESEVGLPQIGGAEMIIVEEHGGWPCADLKRAEAPLIHLVLCADP